jgi:hypothetical protein
MGAAASVQKASKVVVTVKIFPTSSLSTVFENTPRQNDPYKFPRNPTPLAKYKCQPTLAKVIIKVANIFEKKEIMMMVMSAKFRSRFITKSPDNVPKTVKAIVADS